jgi:hypothetical protein
MAEQKKGKGFLMVSMEPTPAYDEEFNDWYDMEHIPDRTSIPGFESGLRYVCVNGWPRYLSMYDLTNIDVLESDAYKQRSWNGFSAWTKRMLTKVRGQWRGSGTQIYPGQALTGHCARLTFLRFRGAPDTLADRITQGVRANYERRPETRQVRILRSNYSNQIDYIGWIEASAPFTSPPDVTLYGEAARYLDMVNEYAPYWTRGPLAGVFNQTRPAEK